MKTKLLSAFICVSLQLVIPAKAQNEIERDRLLRQAFETALEQNPDQARTFLPQVIDKPWLRDMDFRPICELARSLDDPAMAGKLVLAVGLRNPELALRESAQYLPLPDGPRIFERFVLAAPDQAMGIATGSSKTSHATRELMAASTSQEIAILLRLSEDTSIDMLRRGRVAILAARIAHGGLTQQAALKIAGDTPQFFATVLDMRTSASPDDALPLERALENESLVLCQAAQQNLNAIVSGDLAHFRSSDLYALLALGRAEATPQVFDAVFDRLLLPKWKKSDSLTAWLDRTHNWELRDFAAVALDAGRFDTLLSVAGSEIVGRLTRGVAESADPLKEAIRMAEIIDATARPELRDEMASIVSAEFSRHQSASDLRGSTIYGLLAAKLSVDGIGAPYAPFFRSSETLDTALLFGKDHDCIERYFFYDDEDGVASFESFRDTYDRDPAWTIEDRGGYVHLTGKGPGGRRIEIYANVPIDAHLPKNRAFEGEAGRRQQAIAAVLEQRGVIPTVMVHRGHSFWVERTLTYLQKSTLLVILGSCGGSTEVHSVIDASHDAQVIATRGVGETEINDSIMKAVNDRILLGDHMLSWSAFWPKLKKNWGNSALFRDYIAPNQDPGTVFLRAYRRYLDTLN